ncbi:MAG: acyl-CoA dehydrogenase family protein [Pseudomonadota bacterium]
MHTATSPTLNRFREEVREFFDTALTDELRRARRFMTSVYCDRESSLAWQRILHEQGWLVPGWPREYGGTDWSLTERFVFACESARAGPPPISPMGIEMLGPALLGYGTEEQKRYYLPRMLRGEDFWCQGYSEPQAGSDLAALKLRAVPDGDDYVLNGTKLWTTHAHYANRMFCLVRTGHFERPQQGVTFLLVDLDSPGVHISPIRFFSGETEQYQVTFEDVRVPRANVVGKPDEGWAVTKYLLEFERGSKPSAPGLLETVRDLRALVEREGDGEDTTGIRGRIDVLECEVLGLEGTELRCLEEAEQHGSPGSRASLLKIRGAELSQSASQLALEIAGIYGLPWQPEVIDSRGTEPAVGPVDLVTRAPFYFNNRAASIYGGSNEIQRNIIARHVLGL